MAHDPSFEAVLCDVDGVLRRWDGAATAELEKKYVVPPGKLADIAFARHRVGPAVTGTISDEEWRALVARALLPYCGSVDRAAALVSEWSTDAGLVDDQVLDLLRAVRRSVPVVLICNGTTRLERDLGELSLTEAADLVVNSARLGVVQPDPAIYVAASHLVRVPPHRCLFVADEAEYVRGAEAAGMRGVRYEGPDCLRAALASLQLVLN